MTVTVDLIVAMLDLIGRYGGRHGHLGPGGLGKHGGGYGGCHGGHAAPVGQPPQVFGPQPRPMLHPQPDAITRNTMALERNNAILALNQPFDNRDCRWVALGGGPQDPGNAPYPQSNYWKYYINRVLFPQLLTEEDMYVYYAVDIRPSMSW